MASQREAVTPAVTVPAVTAEASKWKPILQIMVSPGNVLKGALADVPLVLPAAVSGVAFSLFFLQSGLDLHRAGAISSRAAAGLTLAGAAYGTAGVFLAALLAWSLARARGGTRTLDWTARAFWLSYSPALIYAASGLAMNLLLGWNTAVAFGVTGMIWALGPMMATVREMAGDKLPLNVAIATLCGTLVLAGWTLIVR